MQSPTGSWTGSHREDQRPPWLTYMSPVPPVNPHHRESSLYRSNSRLSFMAPPLQSPAPVPGFFSTSPLHNYYEISSSSYLDILPNNDDTQTRTPSSRSQNRPIYQNGSRFSYAPSSASLRSTDSVSTWLDSVPLYEDATPSLCGPSTNEDIRILNEEARNMRQALSYFESSMKDRDVILQQNISNFIFIADKLDKDKKKTKAMGIAGGTTGTVGGVTAVAGVVLAPMTMGISLAVAAVGVGMVAAAGGVGAHAAKTNKKTVDRATVVRLAEDHETLILDIERCLDFILCRMAELQNYDLARLQRAGVQPDALNMVRLSQSVTSKMSSGGGTYFIHKSRLSSVTLLQIFVREIDQYFKGKKQKLRKSSRSLFTTKVRQLAQKLQEGLNYLYEMRKTLCCI